MAAVKITVRKNGPYRVEDPEGSIELVDADGNKYDLTGKPAFSLCRCGGSINKPFCDGTHSRIGFQGAESAVKKAEEQQLNRQLPEHRQFWHSVTGCASRFRLQRTPCLRGTDFIHGAPVTLGK